MTARRRQAYRRGVVAESVAALILRLRGYRILARRFRTPVGEIDLVALRGTSLVFVEVKRRKSHADAAWSLPTRQRRRILRAAQYWLASHPAFHNHDMRFDLVLTAPLSWPQFVENAFSL